MKIVFALILLCTPILHAGDMEHRYNAVRSLLDKYQRPFTVLELTTQPQALSFSIAHDYDAVCVVAAPDDANILLEQCHLCDTYGNIILLKKKFSLKDIGTVKNYNHFDVVLIWDIHSLLEKKRLWLKNIKKIVKLGDHIIIEIPSLIENSLIRIIKPYLRRTRFTQKGSTFTTLAKHTYSVGTIFQFTHKIQHLNNIPRYQIISSFEEKKFLKQNTILTNWEPGINLQTFKVLNGIYPEKKIIRKLLEPFKKLDHPDLLMKNIIIQGKKLIPIDWEGKYYYDPQETIPKMIEAFKD